MRYARIVNGSVVAGPPIQTRAALVLAPLQPAAAAVMYTVATGTSADGLYVDGTLATATAANADAATDGDGSTDADASPTRELASDLDPHLRDACAGVATRVPAARGRERRAAAAAERRERARRDAERLPEADHHDRLGERRRAVAVLPARRRSDTEPDLGAARAAHGEGHARHRRRPQAHGRRRPRRRRPLLGADDVHGDLQERGRSDGHGDGCVDRSGRLGRRRQADHLARAAAHDHGAGPVDELPRRRLAQHGRDRSRAPVQDAVREPGAAVGAARRAQGAARERARLPVDGAVVVRRASRHRRSREDRDAPRIDPAHRDVDDGDADGRVVRRHRSRRAHGVSGLGAGVLRSRRGGVALRHHAHREPRLGRRRRKRSVRDAVPQPRRQRSGHRRGARHRAPRPLGLRAQIEGRHLVHDPAGLFGAGARRHPRGRGHHSRQQPHRHGQRAGGGLHPPRGRHPVHPRRQRGRRAAHGPHGAPRFVGRPDRQRRSRAAARAR